MTYFWLAMFFGAVLTVIPSVMSSLDSFWLPIMRNKTLWGVISTGIYTCAISGMIFDIIRSPPMYYANPQNGHNVLLSAIRQSVRRRGLRDRLFERLLCT